ncbi:hypothetical protein KJ762_07240 [bacterium]|nr:hypothetical protein [bacterium]MBU1066137.1 hypothetical protein [bacterium]MBU1634289.1 hypothetical protein [bacterium]MBU1875259.1 hypothetical protein [bacterium]
MKPNRIFNFNRFLLLLRNDLFRNYRTLLIGAGTVAAIYFVATLTPMIFSRENIGYDFNTGFFPTVLYICGFLLSAAAFGEIHHTQKNTAFFMLPATTFEKFTSRLLLTTIGYLVISVVFYFILNMLSLLLSALFINSGFPVFNPFSEDMLMAIAIYLITQSIFLFGSIFFKNHAFMKTGLSLFGLSVVIGIFASIVFRIVYHDFFDHMRFMDNYMASDFIYLENFGETLLSIVKHIFWFVLAPYFWIVAYFRLSEKEV